MFRITGATPGRRIAPKRHADQPRGRKSDRKKAGKSPATGSPPREQAIQKALENAVRKNREALNSRSARELPAADSARRSTTSATPDQPSKASPAPSSSAKASSTKPAKSRKQKKNKTKRLSSQEAAEKAAREQKRRDKKEKRRRGLITALREIGASDTNPGPSRWARRQEEIQAFISDIQSAPFEGLLKHWRNGVKVVAYIDQTGRNFNRRPAYQLLLATIEHEWQRRSRLTYSPDEYFDWPTTHAGSGQGKSAGIDWASEGALSYLGYRVGETSDLRQMERHAILKRFFSMSLPPIECPSYVASWGEPESAARLKKMADSIAAFTRFAKRRKGFDMSTAISEWENDLKMLHDEFYVTKFGFGWPSS